MSLHALNACIHRHAEAMGYGRDADAAELSRRS